MGGTGRHALKRNQSHLCGYVGDTMCFTTKKCKDLVVFEGPHTNRPSSLSHTDSFPIEDWGWASGTVVADG